MPAPPRHSGADPGALARDTVVFIARSLLRLPRSLAWVLAHCYRALANDRSCIGWLGALAFGAFPPILWTYCFKQAKHIPDSWRPKIHTDILPIAEDIFMSPLGVLAFTLLLYPVSHVLCVRAGMAPFPLFEAPTVNCAAHADSPRHSPKQPLLRGFNAASSSAKSNVPGQNHTDLELALAASEKYEQRGSLYPHGRTRSSSASSTSTIVAPCTCPTDADYSHRGYLKVYALIVITYPLILRAMHYLAFTPIRPYKDLMAWATYGALHFASPIISGWWLWFFAPPGAARTYGWCLGFQNIVGVLTHLTFPNAAPWFYDVYGPSLAPEPHPDYSYTGNPAGLVRVDALLGTRLYAGGFKHSPVVFGAFPSLHAATAVISALFVARYSRRKGLAFMLIYTYWMFWSTIYFHHHYAVDLIGGTLLASLSFLVARHSGILAALETKHAEIRSTIGWDRVFLGEGFFGTSLGRRWGSGHYGDSLSSPGITNSSSFTSGEKAGSSVLPLSHLVN